MNNEVNSERDYRDHSTKPHFHFPFSFEQHFQPWYDDRRDYNTNAPSYYDYLAHIHYYSTILTDFVNELAKRKVLVEDTDSVNLEIVGDWLKQLEVTLSATVNLSTYSNTVIHSAKLGEINKQFTSSRHNAIKILNDGLYSPDFTSDINNLLSMIMSLNEYILGVNDKLNNTINDFNNKLNNTINDLNNKIKKLNDGINGLDAKIKDITQLQKQTLQPPYTTIAGTLHNVTKSGSVEDKYLSAGFSYAELESNGSLYQWIKLSFEGYDIPGSGTFLTFEKSDLLSLGVTEEWLEGVRIHRALFIGFYDRFTNDIVSLVGDYDGSKLKFSVYSKTNFSGSKTKYDLLSNNSEIKTIITTL